MEWPEDPGFHLVSTPRLRMQPSCMVHTARWTCCILVRQGQKASLGLMQRGRVANQAFDHRVCAYLRLRRLYLGHTNPGVRYKGKTRDALFAALLTQVATYTILPLTSFKRAQLVNLVLIPTWVYKSLLLWHVCWANHLEAAFGYFVLQPPQVEKYPLYRIHTNVNEGHVGLYGAWWAGLCALIQLVQHALRTPHRPITTHTNCGHFLHMAEKAQARLAPIGGTH